MENILQLREELAEYKIREQEMTSRLEELTDFVENAALPLHWVDAQGIIVWANQAELDTLGYTKEEYIGLPISNFHVEEEVISDILIRLINNETLDNYKSKLRCKDGSVRHVLISSNVFRKNGVFIHTRCFTRDITPLVLEQERKTGLIRQLEKSEVQLRMANDLIESSFDAIISKNMDNIITGWNASAEKMFGYTAQEIIGQSSLLLLPAGLREEEQIIHAQLKKGERLTHFETMRITKDHNILEVSLTMSPIFDTNGHITGVSKIIRDITERKLDQQRKNDFVALVSHELKTPLTSILSYIQLLLSKAKKTEDTFSILSLSKAEIQAKRMTSMINDFLNIGRLEQAKIQLSNSEFELHLLVQETIQEIQLVHSSHNIECYYCGVTTIYADRDKIGQVFNNLISNAIKYSPQKSTIGIDFEIIEKNVRISITDQGVGISKKDQEQLFQRFYRVEDERTKNISGFGIGLYLVSEILRYHSTVIEVQSEREKGSTFSFSLPYITSAN